MIRTKFYVRSDVDDNNIRAEFDNQVDAIAYASGFSPMDKCYVVEATVDVDEESGEVLRELESEKIWSFEDLPTEDAFGVNDWPDVSIKDEEEMKLDTDFDVKDIHEELEAREDLVECQHCFDLFPKEECTKIEYGYLCPHCHSLVVKQVEFPSEMVDDAVFGLEFPEPVKFDDDGDDEDETGEYTEMKPEEPTFVSADEVTPEEPVAIETPVEETPEVSIKTPVAFADIPVTAEGSEPEDGSSDDSSDDFDEILDEHVQDRPAPIEDKTELHGMDNAVVDCQTDMKVIAHSEDEKPLDCLMKKPALEEPLAGEKVDVKLNESLDDELVAFAASLPEDLHEEVLDEGPIFDKIKSGFKKVGNKIGDVAASVKGGTNKNVAEYANKTYNGQFIVKARDSKNTVVKEMKFQKFEDADGFAKQWSANSNNGMATILGGATNKILRTYEDGNIDKDDIRVASKDASVQAKQDDRNKEIDKKADKFANRGEEVKKEAPKKEEPKLDPRWQDDKKTTDNNITTDAVKTADDKTNYSIDNKEEKPTEAPVKEEPKEEPKAEEKPAEKAPVTKRDMSKQNEARAQYKKIEKALEILGVNKDILRDGNKVTQKFKDLRKALFTESYPDMPFDSSVKEGDKIKIIHMEGEDTTYDGAEGTVERIDSIGQLHGTWGGLAVIPGVDEFEVITEGLLEAKKDEEETMSPEEAKLEAHTMLNQLVADEIEAIDGYEASKAELLDKPLEHKEEIIHTIDHIKDEEKEHIDELIQATRKIPFEKPAMEELDEASSAEKKAYKDGGEAYADYIQGKSIARIKDKDMRDAAVALAKANASKDAIGRFTGERKEDQAVNAFDKKQMKMQAAGMTEELHKNEEALVAEWARQGVEVGYVFDEDDYAGFEKLCKDEGVEPSKELFKHYFKCVDDLVGVKEESLEWTADKDLADDRTPAPTPKGELGEPLDGTEVRKHEKAIKEDINEDDAKIVDYVEYKHSYCHALEPKLKKINYYANVLKKPVNYIKAMVKGIIKDSPEVRWTDKEVWFWDQLNQLWPDSYQLFKFIKNSIEKARNTWVYVDAEGELIPELNKDMVSLPIKEDFADDEIETCAWCGEEYPISDLHKEVDLGYLCPDCEQAIKSRGEKLTFEE